MYRCRTKSVRLYLLNVLLAHIFANNGQRMHTYGKNPSLGKAVYI